MFYHGQSPFCVVERASQAVSWAWFTSFNQRGSQARSLFGVQKYADKLSNQMRMQLLDFVRPKGLENTIKFHSNKKKWSKNQECNTFRGGGKSSIKFPSCSASDQKLGLPGFEALQSKLSPHLVNQNKTPFPKYSRTVVQHALHFRYDPNLKAGVFLWPLNWVPPGNGHLLVWHLWVTCSSLGMTRQRVFSESCWLNRVLALSPHAQRWCLLQQQAITEVHTQISAKFFGSQSIIGLSACYSFISMLWKQFEWKQFD